MFLKEDKIVNKVKSKQTKVILLKPETTLDVSLVFLSISFLVGKNLISLPIRRKPMIPPKVFIIKSSTSYKR